MPLLLYIVGTTLQTDFRLPQNWITEFGVLLDYETAALTERHYDDDNNFNDLKLLQLGVLSLFI